MAGTRQSCPPTHPPECPHCGTRTLKWRVPDEASWDEEIFFVCFDDDCSYYRKGWAWMKAEYGREASYRYMINPTSGVASPLPVWSDDATREMIIEDEGGET